MQENRLNGIKISKLDRVKRNTQRYKKLKKNFFSIESFFLNLFLYKFRNIYRRRRYANETKRNGSYQNLRFLQSKRIY